MIGDCFQILTTGPKHPEQRSEVAFYWVVIALIHDTNSSLKLITASILLGNEVNHAKKIKHVGAFAGLEV